MKFIKKITAFALCAIMVLAFATPLAAEEPNSALEMRIAMLEAQIAELLAQLTAAAPTVDHNAISRQRLEAEQLERLMFQFQYYGVTIAIAQNELLISHQALTERQVELEKIRLELGLTTQNNLDDLTALLNSLDRQIALNRETIQAERRYVDTRRGRDGYDFIRDFRIPSPGSASVRSSDELRRNLIDNNATLAVLDGHLGQAWRHGASWNEIRLLEEQHDLLTRQLELAAITSWNNYQSARTAHDLARAERPLLQSRLNLVEERFYLGELSEVDKMGMSFAIQAEKFAADATAIALAMAIAELEFMRRGIMVN